MFKLTINLEDGEMLHIEDCQHTLEFAVNSNESFASVHLDEDAENELLQFLQERVMQRNTYG